MPQLWHVGAVRRPGMEPDPTVPGMGPMDVVENGERVVTEGHLRLVPGARVAVKEQAPTTKPQIASQELGGAS